MRLGEFKTRKWWYSFFNCRPINAAEATTMPLGKHTRTEKGTFRRERNDSTARTLREDYPEFSKVRADAELGNIKKKLGLPPDASINAVRKALRE